MMKIKNTRLYRFICKILDIDKKYNITVMSSSLSFYMLVSVFSLSVIFIQIINTKNDIMDNILVLKLLSIFSDNFSELLKEIIPKFTLDNYTSYAALSVIWSASCTVHSYNKIADDIYIEVEKRKGIRFRINSLLMFLMLFVIVLFEIVFIVFSHYLLKKHFGLTNLFIINLIELVLEILMIYFLILILYIYVPPVKMSFKKVFLGSTIITFSLYLVLQVYFLIIKIYEKISIASLISFIASSFLVFIFIVNYLIILGIIINYNLNGKTMKNKKIINGENNSEYKEE